MAAHPERYELHFEDETHLDTNPHLSRVWHRVGARCSVTGSGRLGRRDPVGSGNKVSGNEVSGTALAPCRSRVFGEGSERLERWTAVGSG